MKEYWELFVQSFQKYAHYMAYEMTSWRWDNYFYWFIGISLLCFFLEMIVPMRKGQRVLRRDFWLDAFYMVFNLYLFSLIGFHAVSEVFVVAFNDFLFSAFKIQNWIAIEIGNWPVWAQLATLFFLRDFIHWNIHRLLHRVPFLWEFHKVHHSAKEMGFATHLRFHWVEMIAYRILEYIPLGMIGFGIREFFLVYIISLGMGHFSHSNIRISLGPLKYVFNNPEMHQWHHAKDIPRDFRYGINYGISLSIWDYIFGTACIPKDNENIEFGFKNDEHFPKGFWGQVTYGFRNRRKHHVSK